MLTTIVTLAALPTLALHASTTLLRAYEARRGKGSPGKQPLTPVFSAWFAEWFAQTAALLALPLRAFPQGHDDPARDRQAMLLIPGWGLGRASMFWFSRRLRARGHAVHIVDLPTCVGRYEQEAPALAAEILRRAAVAGVGRYDVLTHGDAGLVLRLAANVPEVASLLGNVVTLGCPHGGTAPTHLLRGSLGAALRPGSNFILRLEEFNKWQGCGHATAIASEMDAIVFPTVLASWQDALNVRVELVGHVSMLFAQRVFDLASENLEHRPAR
jgi:triacylglycerol esterase/lipase EstA (alpha/beta hydrolase family)